MVQNQGSDAMAGLNPHTQRSDLPGASAAGAACAKAADLYPRVSDLGVAIDAWMAGLYHRRPMLDPQLERIGVGYARLPDGMLTAALRFENATRRRGGWPVAYPADKQQRFRWIMAQNTPTRSLTMAAAGIRSRCLRRRPRMAQGACERVAFAPPDVSLIAAIRSFETSPVIKLPLTPPTQTHANTVTRCDFLRYRVSVVA